MPDEGRTLRRPMAEMQVQVLPARLPFAFTFMNRIERYLQQSPDPPSLGDFYILSGDFGRVCVSHDVARYIVRLLNRWFVPTWIEFPDRVGSIVRVRARTIRVFVESTVEQRAADRVFDRAREAEENGDRKPWDNDGFC